jgi:hypothetical protein
MNCGQASLARFCAATDFSTLGYELSYIGKYDQFHLDASQTATATAGTCAPSAALNSLKIAPFQGINQPTGRASRVSAIHSPGGSSPSKCGS